MMTDDEAIRLCQEGGRDAFGHLVERYKDTLFGTAVLMKGSRTAAEDHVQDALLAAWRGISGFRRGRPFKPWVVRILVNGIVSRGRRRAVATAPLDEAKPTADPGAPDLAEAADAGRRHELVQGALGRLSPEHAQVVTLRYFADLSVPDTARALGIREGTAKSRLHRALGQMREELGPLAAEEEE